MGSRPIEMAHCEVLVSLISENNYLILKLVALHKQELTFRIKNGTELYRKGRS